MSSARNASRGRTPTRALCGDLRAAERGRVNVYRQDVQEGLYLPNSSTEVADVETVRIEPISLETVLWIEGRGRKVVLGCANMLVGVGAGKSEAAEAGVGVGAV